MKTVVFNFDGVIHSYTSGWKGTACIPNPPVEGIKEAIEEIRSAGYRVVVVSNRCKLESGRRAISRYLREYDITVDEISAEAPPAIAYIGDRALYFDGNSSNLLDKIKNFEPWYKSTNNIVKTTSEQSLSPEDISCDSNTKCSDYTLSEKDLFLEIDDSTVLANTEFSINDDNIYKEEDKDEDN